MAICLCTTLNESTLLMELMSYLDLSELINRFLILESNNYYNALSFLCLAFFATPHTKTIWLSFIVSLFAEAVLT